MRANEAYFNSRPSARGDVCRRTSIGSGGNFNSRPSARGDVHIARKQWGEIYFNSRPSARGDAKGRAHNAEIQISIHAPPRGATLASGVPVLPICISIHAPPRGATDGGDDNGLDAGISIHAPPRGATCELTPPIIGVGTFQFTPLREGRPKMPDDTSGSCYFNSRPSARGDKGVSPAELYKLFQFTPLREGRQAKIC